jgi:hypothetical protein
MEASRIAFDPTACCMGIGGPGTGSKISMDQAQGTNDLAGKILRMTDEGKVPPDNPFVGKGWLQARSSLGHRVRLGLAFNPYFQRVVETENGPNGGDELNIVRAGRNYGWPIVSYGRDYNGPRFSPTLPGMEDPLVFWVPSIATSGLTFTPATSSRAGSATSSSAGCARVNRGAPDQRTCSTTNGKRCAANRCCVNCTSASGTSGRALTDSCTCSPRKTRRLSCGSSLQQLTGR